MKLASLKGGRDGRLVVVSNDLAWFTDAGTIAPDPVAAPSHGVGTMPRYVTTAEQGVDDFETWARRYWSAWGDSLRSPAPAASVPGWNEALSWWTQLAQGGSPAADDAVSRFNAQAQASIRCCIALRQDAADVAYRTITEQRRVRGGSAQRCQSGSRAPINRGSPLGKQSGSTHWLATIAPERDGAGLRLTPRAS